MDSENRIIVSTLELSPLFTCPLLLCGVQTTAQHEDRIPSAITFVCQQICPILATVHLYLACGRVECRTIKRVSNLSVTGS